jgi:diguanylate cyclase (GGDEF)-like protein
MAGSASSQVCTFLACLAVGLATMSAVTALGGFVPRLLRRCTIALGVLVVLIGIPGGLTTGPTIELLSPIMAFLTLADLAAVALCLILSDRRGSDEARDLAKTWTVPMAALALTMFVDLDTRLFGGGSQIAVLFASALQSIWLSIAVTPRLAHLRVELDAARQAEAALAELASRDPLTGLLNRRGFVQQLEEVCPPADRAALGLMLVDVDLFKSINDRFGHECGDAVLQRLADCFRAFDEQGCITGRMGGEEFVIAVRDLSPFALEQLAERIRSEVAACDHGEVSRYRAVTVSIGVAQGLTATPFQKLYSTADRALYEAKRSGRNRVVFPLPGEVSESREAIERDQLSFPWPEPAAR